MANKLVRPLAASFQVDWRGEQVTLTHETAFISGGAFDDMHIQWRPGFFLPDGSFQRVTIRGDARTSVRGYRLPPQKVQAIMDRPESGEGNFDLEQLITEADLETPVIFGNDEVLRVQGEPRVR